MYLPVVANTTTEPNINDRVQLHTKTANITGITVNAARRSVARFSGIQYATASRWQAPVINQLKGDVDATEFAPICPQLHGNRDWYISVAKAFGGKDADIPSRPELTEDCLYLNIWTPDTDKKNLPVVVWIHGGSNKNGYSYEPNYLGHHLAARDVVVVSIAYRLGVLGFLSHKDFPVPGSGNFGLLDQITALEWIQHYISAFGGNPNNITLFGESAGAADIGYLMFAPSARLLFHKAISQSGGWVVGRQTTLAMASELGASFASAAGEHGDLQSLYLLAPEELVALAASHFEGHYWDPVIDGETLPDTMPTLLKSQDFTKLPLLIGSNRDESLMYLPANVDEGDWLSALQRSFGPAAKEFIERDAHLPLRERMNRLQTALSYLCPSRLLAAANSAGGGSSYVYEFTRVRSTPHGLGAYHGAEIPYILNTHDDWLPTDQTDRQLTQSMMDFWMRFAQTGDPTFPGSPIWKAYTQTKPWVMQLDIPLQSGISRNDFCATLPLS